MSEHILPIHPVTGLRAIGITKRGPVWPVLGGSEDATDEERNTAKGGPTLTHSQSVKRLDEVHARMEELGELDDLSEEEQREFDDLGDEFREVDEHRKRLERAAKLAEVRTGASQVPGRRLRLERGSNSQGSRDDYDRDSILEPDSIEDCRFRNPWDLREVRTFGRDQGDVAAELTARAKAAVEKMPGCSDSIRQAATQIIERWDSSDSKIARHALITSSPAYLRAWSKMACNRQHTMSVDEQRAMNEAESFRAMSLTDSAGGYLVPFQLDPTVIVTSNGSRNDIRMAARQVIATGDTWNGVSSANVSWSWDAEASEVSDDSPTFAQPSIPIYKAAGFVPISIEAMQDEQNVAQEVGKLLVGGKEDLDAVAFATGSGSGQPTGIITALTGTASVVNAAADDTFALKDVYALQGALPARYRSQASWLANNLIYNLIRQFDTAGGAGLWNTVGDDRANVLLGRRVLEAEAMDGTITTSGAVHNYAAVYGDFSNYVIADRIGMTVEFIPHLFHTANNRPSGQRGWYAYARVGADSVNDGAFRMLDVVSAA
jgi:HK97 family phage major capsid protein